MKIIRVDTKEIEIMTVYLSSKEIKFLIKENIPTKKPYIQVLGVNSANIYGRNNTNPT